MRQKEKPIVLSNESHSCFYFIFFRQTKLKTEKAKALWRLILNNSLKKLESEKRKGFNRTSQQRQTKETWTKSVATNWKQTFPFSFERHLFKQDNGRTQTT
jgi:hypothetical protein